MNRATLALALGCAAALAWALTAQHGKSLAITRAEHADSVADAADLRADRKVTAFFHDTTRIYRSVATVDTLLSRIIDTAIVHHTDTVKVAVSILRAADDTLKACSLAVRQCAGAVESLREARDSLRLARDAWSKAAKGCRLAWSIPCPTLNVGVGAVYANGQVHAGPAVTFGVSIPVP